MALFWLSDEAWVAIEPHLPMNQPGARRVEDRRVISGILHVLKVGCRWCDCPNDYGPSTPVQPVQPLVPPGLLAQAARLLGGCRVTKNTAIDSTYVEAQRAAFGAKGGVRRKQSAVRTVAGPRRSLRSPTSSAAPMR